MNWIDIALATLDGYGLFWWYVIATAQEGE